MEFNDTRLLQFFQNFKKYHACCFAPLAEETGLSMRELQVLLFLINNPGYDTARDITVLRGISKSQVSQAVDLLWAEGLLDRTPDSADRRIVHLSITEAGLPVARRAQEVQNACGVSLLSGLSADETAQLFALVDRVVCNTEALAGEAE